MSTTRRAMLRALPGAAAALGTLALTHAAAADEGEIDPDLEVERAITALAEAMQRAGWRAGSWSFVAGSAAVPMVVLDSEGRSFFRLTPPADTPPDRTSGT